MGEEAFLGWIKRVVEDRGKIMLSLTQDSIPMAKAGVSTLFCPPGYFRGLIVQCNFPGANTAARKAKFLLIT